MGPILGGMKQCKCMVILRDVPLIVHEVWVGNIMTPCVFRFIRTWKSPGFVCFFEERSVFWVQEKIWVKRVILLMVQKSC